jgi:hypothetical protein
VLIGREFWRLLMDFLRTRLLEGHMIDSDQILVTDSPEEAIRIVTSLNRQ